MKLIIKYVPFYLICFILPEIHTNQNINTFKVGERLVYQVRWGVIPAGTATLEIANLIISTAGFNTYHFISQTQSNSFFDMFYRVRDINEAWWDSTQNVSLGYRKSLKEGNYRKEEKIILDPGRQIAYFDTKPEDKVSIPENTLDVLSSLYYVRTVDWTKRQKVSFPVHSGNKIWTLEVIPYGKKKVTVPAGEFECWLIEPVMKQEGIFRHKGRLWVYLTNDARKVPVLLRTEIMVGVMDVELQEISLP